MTSRDKEPGHLQSWNWPILSRIYQPQQWLFLLKIFTFNVHAIAFLCTVNYAPCGFRACLNTDSLNGILILETKALTWFPVLDPCIPVIWWWWAEASIYEFHTGQLKYLTDDLTTPHDGEVKQFELRGHPDGSSCGKWIDTHDDVIKWKIFGVTGLLCGKFTGRWWIPSDAELCCVLSAPEPTVEQEMETPVIWDAVSLWRHCNDTFLKLWKSWKVLS